MMHLPGASVTKHIIGICGKRRAGKDAVAEHLVANYCFVNCKIAAKLKDVCQLLFNFTDEEIEVTKDETNCKWHISPRQAMQFIGTELMQYEIQKLLPGIQRTFWIKSMLESNYGHHERIVISDLRFLHEVETISKYIAESNTKFTIIRIHRQHPASSFSFNATDDHISEQECNDISADIVVDNDGAMCDLLNKIDKAMRPVLQR
jgi:dephospho-CoA kinase